MNIITTVAIVVIPAGLLVYNEVRDWNKEAKEKGTGEKGYTYRTVIFIFVLLCIIIYYEMFLNSTRSWFGR